MVRLRGRLFKTFGLESHPFAPHNFLRTITNNSSMVFTKVTHDLNTPIIHQNTVDIRQRVPAARRAHTATRFYPSHWECLGVVHVLPKFSISHPVGPRTPLLPGVRIVRPYVQGHHTPQRRVLRCRYSLGRCRSVSRTPRISERFLATGCGTSSAVRSRCSHQLIIDRKRWSSEAYLAEHEHNRKLGEAIVSVSP